MIIVDDVDFLFERAPQSTWQQKQCGHLLENPWASLFILLIDAKKEESDVSGVGG
jgi:hypothetical protein